MKTIDEFVNSMLLVKSEEPIEILHKEIPISKIGWLRNITAGQLVGIAYYFMDICQDLRISMNHINNRKLISSIRSIPDLLRPNVTLINSPDALSIMEYLNVEKFFNGRMLINTHVLDLFQFVESIHLSEVSAYKAIGYMRSLAKSGEVEASKLKYVMDGYITFHTDHYNGFSSIRPSDLVINLGDDKGPYLMGDIRKGNMLKCVLSPEAEEIYYAASSLDVPRFFNLGCSFGSKKENHIITSISVNSFPEVIVYVDTEKEHKGGFCS